MTSTSVHYQLVKLADRRYRWRLVGGNGRPLGVSATELHTLEECLDAISRLRALVPDAVVRLVPDGNRAMTWAVRVHDGDVALAPRSYQRSLEAESSATRFLEAAGRALVAPRITSLDRPQARYRPQTRARSAVPET